MSFVWLRALRSMTSSPCRPRLGACAVPSLVRERIELGPAEDGVQRRAELVAERGEELVLEAVGLALIGEQGVLDRDRRNLREHGRGWPRRRW
jgi:hypothetical protein